MAEPGADPVLDAMVSWFGLGSAAANVIMQLAWLPVGHGVAESRVESGRGDKHPIKRTRTTLSYIMIALYGTDHERAVLRGEVNRQHRQVRSTSDDPVRYHAMDPDLQLWVAACLYRGFVDVLRLLHGPLTEGTLDAVYRHAARMGTTLQVDPARWPADRAEFDRYWADGVAKIEMDELTRGYLLDLASLRALPRPVSLTLGPLHRLITAGFLPPEFRDELGLRWNPRRARIFAAYTAACARINRVLPLALRQFPWNIYLWDARRRIRNGAALV
jgi:uncharacterized protein (DUF2236 family)